MPIFEYFRATVQSAKQMVRKVVVPSIFSFFKLVADSGKSLFPLPLFIGYVTNEQKHPANLPAQVITIVITVIVDLATRVPAIFRHFHDMPMNEPSLSTAEKPCVQWIDPELGYVGSGLYQTLKMLNIGAMLFASLYAYLGANQLGELIMGKKAEADEQATKEYMTQVIGLLFALSNMMSYYTFYLKKANRNSKNLADAVVNHHYSFHTKHAIKTGIVTFPSLITTPFFAYFSTVGALDQLPWAASESTKQVFASLSCLTSIVAYFTTQVPAVYAVFDDTQSTLQHHAQSCWGKTVVATVYIAGMGDLGVSIVGNFMGMVSTCHRLFGVGERDPSMIVAASMFSTSSAFVNFFFSVHQGFQETLKHHYRLKAEHSPIIPNGSTAQLMLRSTEEVNEEMGEERRSLNSRRGRSHSHLGFFSPSIQVEVLQDHHSLRYDDLDNKKEIALTFDCPY